MREFVSQAQLKEVAAGLAQLAGRFLPPWIVLLLSLFVTLVAWQMTAEQNLERAKLRFAFEIQQVEQSIQERVSLHQSALRGARGRLAGGSFISEADWRRYLEDINIQQGYAGLETIGLAMRVTAADKALFMQTMRALGREDYQIRPAGDRPLYFPVTYLEPPHPSGASAVGFDMWSDPPRREAMRRATREGELAITKKLKLVTAGIDATYGFSMFLPVYAGGGVPVTVDQREARLVAFVFSPYTMQQFLDGVFRDGTAEELTLRVYDGTKPDPDELLYDSMSHFNPSPLDASPSFERFRTIEVGGSPWTSTLR